MDITQTTAAMRKNAVEIVSCLTEDPELLRITKDIFFRMAKRSCFKTRFSYGYPVMLFDNWFCAEKGTAFWSIGFGILVAFFITTSTIQCQAWITVYFSLIIDSLAAPRRISDAALP
jgi:hypothetical protein